MTVVLRTSYADRMAAISAGEGLGQHFKAGTWENQFVADLARDVETLLDQYEPLIGDSASPRVTQVTSEGRLHRWGPTITNWLQGNYQVCEKCHLSDAYIGRESPCGSEVHSPSEEE